MILSTDTPAEEDWIFSSECQGGNVQNCAHEVKECSWESEFKILILYFINLCAYIQAYGARWLAVLKVLKEQYYNSTSALLQPNKDVIIIFTATRYDIIQYSTIHHYTTFMEGGGYMYVQHSGSARTSSAILPQRTRRHPNQRHE